MPRTFVEATPQLSATAAAQVSQGATAAQILAANGKRKGMIIQNTGTTVIKLAFASTGPTQTAYHIALAACTGADGGDGGIYMDDAWVGIVRAISSTAGGTLVVTEFATGSPDFNQSGDMGLS